ncbi:MAG: hypothetical protein ACOCVF_02575 [bacterium]
MKNKQRLFEMMGVVDKNFPMPQQLTESFQEEQINQIIEPDSHFGYSIQIGNGETGQKTKVLNITREQLSAIKNILNKKGMEAQYSMNEKISSISDEEHTNTDPTKGEMVAFLRGNFENYDDFSAEEAIYWFGYDYHGGQDSNLYSALSTSKYKPSPLMNNSDDLDGLSKMMYEALVNNFT